MKKQCAYPYYEHKRLYTLKELVRFCAEAYGEKPAFLFRERKAPVEISYLRFREDVCALGSWMLLAFGPDAHVGILGENSYEWILTHFAVTCGGGVAVPIDKDLDAEEITRLLKDSGCEVLFHSNTYADVAASLRQALPQLRLQNMKTIQDLIDEGWWNSGWNLEDKIIYMGHEYFSYSVHFDEEIEDPASFDEEDLGPLVITAIEFSSVDNGTYMPEE